MLRIIAILFGIGFIFIGVAGFLSALTVNGLLFGYFETNTVHNLVHLVSGVLAIMAATHFRYSKLYFQVFGILYALITIMGFIDHGDLRLMMHFNMADNILHLVIAIVALYLGFFTNKTIDA